MKVQTLPEPGIDVFIRFQGKQILARRTSYACFTPATFSPNANPIGISTDVIDGWDYAVPAGDML